MRKNRTENKDIQMKPSVHDSCKNLNAETWAINSKYKTEGIEDREHRKLERLLLSNYTHVKDGEHGN